MAEVGDDASGANEELGIGAPRRQRCEAIGKKEENMSVAMHGITDRVLELLGHEAETLLDYKSHTVQKSELCLPGPDFIDRVLLASDRSNTTLRNLQMIFNHGRLGGTGYLSILPVDQGVEHSAGASFAINPEYFDPEYIVRLAIEGGCNAVVSTLGGLGIVSRKYAHKIPFIVKLNHNELLSYPNTYDQIKFASARQAWEMGAVGVGATIYFGSPESRRQIIEVSQWFQASHELGMFTVLWCYLRNPAFKKDRDYQLAADLTGQANHLGVTVEADIIKQKLPETNGGYSALSQDGVTYGRTNENVYTQLTTDDPIDLCRYQVINCYMGRIPLVNSGGASGKDDLAEAVRTAVINKRAGGAGLIIGRKSFSRPMNEGIDLLTMVQDIYLSPGISIA